MSSSTFFGRVTIGKSVLALLVFAECVFPEKLNRSAYYHWLILASVSHAINPRAFASIEDNASRLGVARCARDCPARGVAVRRWDRRR